MANRRNYSSKEETLLLKMKDEDGKTFEEISKYLKRTPKAVEAKYHKLKSTQKKEESEEITSTQLVSSPTETVFVLKMDKIREALPKGAVVKFKSGESWIELEI